MVILTENAVEAGTAAPGAVPMSCANLEIDHPI